MSWRMRRVNAAVREVLAEAVGELRDPRIGFVTVTAVETSSDLRHAVVYFSVLGSETKREKSLEGLAAAHGVLQARIAQELRLKRTPQLTFEYDPTVERGVRMSHLIDGSPQAQTTSDLAAVADALRRHDRFLLMMMSIRRGRAGSHPRAKLLLDALGKDSSSCTSRCTRPPAEYKFMPLDNLRRELPEDVSERVLFALDCANESRLGEGQAALSCAARPQRRPPPRQLALRQRQPRRGRCVLLYWRIVRDLVRELGLELTPDLAEAIYIALVTDTGRFQYANTTPKALRLAAELVEAGADVRRVFQSVYETVHSPS